MSKDQTRVGVPAVSPSASHSRIVMPSSSQIAHHRAIALRLEEAVATYGHAIKQSPDFATNYKEFGDLLERQGKLEDADATFREAIRRSSNASEAHRYLGGFLTRQGRYVEAVAEYREAIRLEPRSVFVQIELGATLETQGKIDEAEASYRETIRFKPENAWAHKALGEFLARQGRLDEAITSYRKAIELRANHPQFYFEFGFALRSQGDYIQSLAMIRKGHELAIHQRYTDERSEDLIQAERVGAMADRIPGLLAGSLVPNDNRERLTLAQLCYDTKRQATAARYWSEALEADPKLGADRSAGYRYKAACAAALAGTGRGKDNPMPDEDAKAKLRAQALGWLRADLAVWDEVVKTGPDPLRAKVRPRLEHWKQDQDLIGVREPKELAKLPEGERAEWQTFWGDVEALIKRTKSP